MVAACSESDSIIRRSRRRARIPALRLPRDRTRARPHPRPARHGPRAPPHPLHVPPQPRAHHRRSARHSRRQQAGAAPAARRPGARRARRRRARRRRSPRAPAAADPQGAGPRGAGVGDAARGARPRLRRRGRTGRARLGRGDDVARRRQDGGEAARGGEQATGAGPSKTAGAAEAGMKKTVEFLYDYASPWAFLANALLAKRLPGVEIFYVPVYLAGFDSFAKGMPYSPAKLNYLLRDFQRCAAHEGVTPVFPPTFPINGLYALRGAIAAQRLGCFEDYHAVLFDAAWAQGREIA